MSISVRALRRFGLALAVLGASLGSELIPVPAFAKEAAIYSEVPGGPALSGYDPVGYFLDGKPVKGNSQISATYSGVTWYFASVAHKTTFEANPAKYAPQYGGYCAYAVSQGHTASADPTTGKVVNGKLYVNYNHAVAALWSLDRPGYISKANAHWPSVLGK